MSILNRRSIMGVLAGAPLVGRAVADGALESLRNPVPPSHPYPHAGENCATQAGSLGQKAVNPLMERGNALKIIFGDANALAEIRDELFAENRTIQSVDPDIAILKSLSPMAKITFQRQRNVERALAELQSERWDGPQRYVRVFEERLQKMMWGGR